MQSDTSRVKTGRHLFGHLSQQLGTIVGTFLAELWQEDRGDWHSFEPNLALAGNFAEPFLRPAEPYLDMVIGLARMAA